MKYRILKNPLDQYKVQSNTVQSWLGRILYRELVWTDIFSTFFSEEDAIKAIAELEGMIASRKLQNKWELVKEITPNED